MKAIIGNKLYDTEKAELIYDYLKNEPQPCFWNNKLPINYWRAVDIYKTSKGQYFLHIHTKDNLKERIELIEECDVKNIIQKLNPDQYIEIFGEVEEG